jgi:predicted MPP superfamily phosphohydrolase
VTSRTGRFRAGAALAGASLGAGLAAYALRIEPYWAEFVSRTLPVRDLPPALAGRTLVHISDVHVGATGIDYIARTFARIAALRPDIVVLTGDLVDKYGAHPNDVAWIYEQFPFGRMATIGILGNHDYGLHWEDDAGAAGIIETVESFGMTMLRNDVCEVDGLQVAGLDDLWALQCSPTLALRKLDRTRPMIALTHNPDSVDLAEWELFEGWILAGHTHGGQCRLPLLPPFVPVHNKRYVAGEYELSGNRRLYINRGLGHTYAIRFGARPEVTVFELRSK